MLTKMTTIEFAIFIAIGSAAVVISGGIAAIAVYHYVYERNRVHPERRLRIPSFTLMRDDSVTIHTCRVDSRDVLVMVSSEDGV